LWLLLYCTDTFATVIAVKPTQSAPTPNASPQQTLLSSYLHSAPSIYNMNNSLVKVDGWYKPYSEAMDVLSSVMRSGTDFSISFGDGTITINQAKTHDGDASSIDIDFNRFFDVGQVVTEFLDNKFKTTVNTQFFPIESVSSSKADSVLMAKFKSISTIPEAARNFVDIGSVDTFPSNPFILVNTFNCQDLVVLLLLLRFGTFILMTCILRIHVNPIARLLPKDFV